MSRSPTTEPGPTTTLKTPSGMPASSASSREAERRHRGQLGRLEHDGVAAGERRPELPARDVEREVPGDDETRRRRAARGRSRRRRRRPGSSGRSACRPRPRRSGTPRRPCRPRRASPEIGLPTLRDSSSASSSRCSSTSVASRRSRRARSDGATARQAGKAAFAAATARRSRATPRAGSSSATGCSVAGFNSRSGHPRSKKRSRS